MKYARRRKLVNRRFQLKTTFAVLGFIMIAFLAVFTVVGIYATQNSTQIKASIQVLENLYTAEKAQKAEIGRIARESNNGYVIDSYERNLVTLKKLIDQLDEQAEIHFRLLSMIIGIVLVLSAALYFYLINLTHRISGPIYVLTSYVEDLMEGREPNMRELRTQDEFQEFYRLFTELAEKISSERNIHGEKE